ncbi:7-deoxyloganetin glucosyltransferase [Glycine max]|nr:7-deoxyloganetin glucosyltransferase [Glycine max]
MCVSVYHEGLRFVSADNGTYDVINAYLHRASASFNELNHLHKELGSCDSHNKHKTENGNDSGKVVGNSVQSVDINKELSLRHVKFDQFKRQQSGSGNADGENFSQQGEEENVDEGEMHKKKKKKKQEVESLHDIHSTVKFGVREADGKHVSSRNPTVADGKHVSSWLGLADSKKPFLWIIRPDLVIGCSVILSYEFVNETKDRSLMGNQPTNCRYICNEWEIGIEIDTNVKREEVEKLVNDLMAGEKGKKMRQKIVELKMKAEEGK